MASIAETVAFFDRHAGHISRGYSRTSFNLYENWYSRRRLRTVLAQLEGAGSPSRFTDLGCGSGEITLAVMEKLGNPETVALDLSAAMLQIFRRRSKKGIIFRQAGVVDTGLATEGYDLVTSIGVLPYLPDPEKGIAEIARLLRVDGLAIITYPIKNTPMYFFRETAVGRFIKNRIFTSGLFEVKWSPKQFDDALRRCGLEVQRKDSLWPSEFCVAVRKIRR